MNKGFTILELVIVIVILGIIAITAIPRIIDIGEFRVDMAVRRVFSDLRYARDFSTNHNCKTKVLFDIGTQTYTVYENSSGSWQIAEDPTTRDDFIVILNTASYKDAVIVSVDFDGGSEIQFDSVGVPYSAGLNPLGSTGTVVVGHARTGRQVPINVEPTTGRIYR